MPKKYNAKRKFKPRKQFKKRDNNVSIGTIQRKIPRGTFSKFSEVLPLPPTMYTKFVYVGTNIISSGSLTSAVGTEYQFRLNSIYDPYVGTTGAYNVGCAGFSQLLSGSGPYQRYKVNGVTVELELFDPSGNDCDASEMCMTIFNPTSYATSIVGLSASQIEGLPYGCVKRISGTGSQRRYVKQYLPLWSVMAMTKEQFRVERQETTAPYNGDPSKLVYLTIGLANRRAPSTATDLAVKVKLTFHAELFDRKIAPHA